MICDLYRNSSQANIYINAVFNYEKAQEEILDEYYTRLSQCFICGNPFNPNMTDGRQIIREAEKIAGKQIAMNVMLRFVELGTEFTNTYGDINAAFYNSLFNVFNQFVNLLNAEKDDALYITLKDRIEKVVKESAYIGYGYGDDVKMLNDEIIWH